MFVATIVAIRDNWTCLRCGKPGDDVHEIVPRSHFGPETKAVICFQPKNMCVLCRSCHGKVHNPKGRKLLLAIMAQTYGYDYRRDPWREYTID